MTPRHGFRDCSCARCRRDRWAGRAIRLFLILAIAYYAVHVIAAIAAGRFG
jgi:hypothetical protein